MKYRASLSLMAVALSAFALSGCGSGSPEPSESKTNSASGRSDDHDHGDQAQSTDGPQTDMEKMKAELAKLPPADAAAAEKQHVCPVSGKMLGTMGAPLKIDVDGRQVWICCASCKDQLLENPDEYLAKLEQQ